MAVAKRIRRAVIALLAIFGLLLWFAALTLFTRVTENSDDFSRRQDVILLINSIGIGVLLILIVSNLWRLVRDYRRHVPGSRLRARMVSVLVLVAVTPLVGVYIFSVEFINRGIDNWFSVDIEQALGDALELGQTVLDIQTRARRQQVKELATQLSGVDRASLPGALAALRRGTEATDLIVYGPNNLILAMDSIDLEPKASRYRPTEEVLLQLRQQDDHAYATAEPQPNGQYAVIAAASIDMRSPAVEPEFLLGTFPVDQRASALVNEVLVSYRQFGGREFLRTALKASFTVALSLVLLISLLASVYGAFFFARRLMVPIQLLMQGTRAVARGDFATRVPTPTRDEIGFLVHSFNDMTQRLAQASAEARSSQQQVERERRKLELILARLSTGVVALEPDLRIRTANQAAGAILGVDLEKRVGESVVELAQSRPLLAQFLDVAQEHLRRGESEWREQIELREGGNRRVLMSACTGLPGDNDDPSGYAIVFEDITTLLQAQREAAWGEVARRLAHEIKNPLTPIQLSAERLRRKYLRSPSGEVDLLDRATHTIIQQVEAMKQMVNAFSEYARTPTMHVTRFDLNGLITEVSELYSHQEKPVSIALALSPEPLQIEADAGRLRQVLHNLFRNSIEAMEHQEDARVEIATRKVPGVEPEAVEIKVTDNGPGFSGNIVHEAFDPYVTSKPKGTGLGLAIVRKLVEEHGGQITAANREHGGAEIVILLPIAVDEASHAIARRHDHRRERA
jgi:PAS domain S-box-containing protein